jgi:excisionase family DNA binding protein
MMEFLSVAEAAEQLGVSPRRVRQLIDHEELDASRVGRIWMVHAGSVERRRLQPAAAGRPLDSQRVWSIALVADQLVEELAGAVGGQSVDELLRHEEAALAKRLEGPMRVLRGLDPEEVAKERPHRAKAERALKEALAALRNYRRRERVAGSHAGVLFAVEPARSDGGMRPSEQLELFAPGRRDDRAAIRRLRNSLAHDGDVGPGDLAPFRNRASGARGLYGHPSVLSALEDDERLILSGARAAHLYGADVMPGDDLDAYVNVGFLDALVNQYGLEPAALDEANVLIRPVEQLHLKGVLAPRLLVAADLLERHDPRSRAAAFQLLEALVAAIRWYEEQ